jgi:phosphatidylserine decarboxylase
MLAHQYVERYRNTVSNEVLLADQVISFLYHRSREEPHFLLSSLASGRLTNALAFWQFDRPLRNPKRTIEYAAHRLMIRESEAVRDFGGMRTLRELFERQIRYWAVRPLPESPTTIVSPADGKLLPFDAFATDMLPVKSKFIRVDELLGGINPWSSHSRFDESSMTRVAGAIVRLTPDVYHYTHSPVAGCVVRHEVIEGKFHSCNPTALVRFPGSYAVNRRTLTVYDTDVENGSGVGRVAQVDVAAMMIGQMQSCFSTDCYENPRQMVVGDFVPRGVPVSLFRPGSSTSIVLWDGSRTAVSRELIANSKRSDLRSRFSDWLGQPWVETQVAVRQAISEELKETLNKSHARIASSDLGDLKPQNSST